LAETRLVHLVRTANEPTAWAALEKTAKRVEVGLRMEFLDEVVWWNLSDATRSAVLRFLSRFLDDAEVRVAAGPKYEGPYAARDFARIEVRDHAARQIAGLLRLDVHPEPKWTAPEWAKFREDVRKALAGEGIK
jgi:hypothetical protein